MDMISRLCSLRSIQHRWSWLRSACSGRRVLRCTWMERNSAVSLHTLHWFLELATFMN